MIFNGFNIHFCLVWNQFESMIHWLLLIDSIFKTCQIGLWIVKLLFVNASSVEHLKKECPLKQGIFINGWPIKNGGVIKIIL